MTRKKKIIIRIVIIVVAAFLILVAAGIPIAHAVVFRRADYKGYDSDKYYTYDDIDSSKFPREEIKFMSGDNELTGFMYGEDNTKGLVIISPGHRDPTDVKLYETTYFVKQGFRVFCFDYTGCYNSEGRNMVGYSQSVHDLDAAITYMEESEEYKDMPICLFGHSLGGYATGAVLQYEHKNVKAAIVASGFDTPKEQWNYSIERYTKFLHYPLYPFTNLFIAMKYGNEADLSAVDGINSVDIPVLVISGTNDEFYGGESPIYAKQDEITNPKCSFKLMEQNGHNGHYDYFLTNKAVKYQKEVKKHKHDKIDKKKFAKHDKEFMQYLSDFFISSIEKG